MTTVRTRRRGAALLTAAGIALLAAGSAHAQPNTSPTRKGCTINLQRPDGSPGQSVTYADGYSFSVKNAATGRTHTYTCVDGTWVETVSSRAPAGGPRWEATSVTMAAPGTVVLRDGHRIQSVKRGRVAARAR
jgi:hypothetical protein